MWAGTTDWFSKYQSDSFNGMPLGNKKEWITNTCNNIDKSQCNYAEWKKPGKKKEYIQYYSTYIELENANYSDSKSRVIWGKGVGARSGRETLERGTRNSGSRG